VVVQVEARLEIGLVAVATEDGRDATGHRRNDPDLDQGPVAPQTALAAGIQAEVAGGNGQEAVAVFVDQVAGRGLGAHVPAVERGQRVVDAADHRPFTNR
jgi:hypothetical protein